MKTDFLIYIIITKKYINKIIKLKLYNQKFNKLILITKGEVKNIFYWCKKNEISERENRN